MQVGEELVYGVHYSFFNIGTIRMTVNSKRSIEWPGNLSYICNYKFKSFLSWLVELHILFYSGIDKDLFFSRSWLSEDSSKKKSNRI